MHIARVNTVLPLMLALSLGINAPAGAEEGDGFKLSAGLTQMHDSNLYRLSSGANVLALTGLSSAADTVGVTSVGVAFNKSYSLQRVELGLNLVNYRYQNSSNLNYTAKNMNAAWLWSVTPDLHGVLSSKQTDTLNSFADSSTYNQSNLRTNVDTGLSAEYELGARWRMLGGVSQTKQTNQQAVVAEGDYTANNANVGVRYLLPSGNSITYRLTTTNGSYINRALSAAALYDNGFNQLDNEVRLNWIISGKSSAVLSANHVSRTHSNYSQRDYSGLNAGAAFNWSLTGKAGLSLSWARELASYQTTTANYSQTDRFAISPSWQLSHKTLLRGRYEVAQRDYLGTPLGAVSDPRSDTLYNASLSLDWQPYRFVTVSAGLQNSRRDSNLAGLDYNSNMVTFSAQYSN